MRGFLPFYDLLTPTYAISLGQKPFVRVQYAWEATAATASEVALQAKK